MCEHPKRFNPSESKQSAALRFSISVQIKALECQFIWYVPTKYSECPYKISSISGTDPRTDQGQSNEFYSPTENHGQSVEPWKAKRTSFEKKRSSGIRVTVIKTGDRTKHCVITATSMEQLMSQATEKLKSTTAIRRVFKKMVTFSKLVTILMTIFFD